NRRRRRTAPLQRKPRPPPATRRQRQKPESSGSSTPPRCARIRISLLPPWLHSPPAQKSLCSAGREIGCKSAPPSVGPRALFAKNLSLRWKSRATDLHVRFVPSHSFASQVIVDLDPSVDEGVRTSSRGS